MNTHPDATRWDARYLDNSRPWLPRAPRQLLVDHAHLLPESGLALDAACGVGANGHFLAQHGLRVIALDISLIALRMAVQWGRAHACPLDAAVYDLSAPWLPPERFDVILNFHFLERACIPVFRQALKPDGIIFFETYLRLDPNLESPERYLVPGELRLIFQDYQVLHYAEKALPDIEQLTSRGMAQLVARKVKPTFQNSK
jgi:SAM-dependent methyltransferase